MRINRRNFGLCIMANEACNFIAFKGRALGLRKKKESLKQNKTKELTN